MHCVKVKWDSRFTPMKSGLSRSHIMYNFHAITPIIFFVFSLITPSKKGSSRHRVNRWAYRIDRAFVSIFVWMNQSILYNFKWSSQDCRVSKP